MSVKTIWIIIKEMIFIFLNCALLVYIKIRDNGFINIEYNMYYPETYDPTINMIADHLFERFCPIERKYLNIEEIKKDLRKEIQRIIFDITYSADSMSNLCYFEQEFSPDILFRILIGFKENTYSHHWEGNNTLVLPFHLEDISVEIYDKFRHCFTCQ